MYCFLPKLKQKRGSREDKTHINLLCHYVRELVLGLTCVCLHWLFNFSVKLSILYWNPFVSGFPQRLKASQIQRKDTEKSIRIVKKKKKNKFRSFRLFWSYCSSSGESNIKKYANRPNVREKKVTTFYCNIRMLSHVICSISHYWNEYKR